MELTLTTRWYVLKSEEQTIQLKDGIEVEYYGDRFKWINNPSDGVIRASENGFKIEWEDSEDTILDGSEHANSVIRHCGFKL